MYIGALMYADGLLFICSTVSYVSDDVASVLQCLDMVLNVCKSDMLRIGPHHNRLVSPVTRLIKCAS